MSYPTQERPGDGAPQYPNGTTPYPPYSAVPGQPYSAVPGQPYGTSPSPFGLPMAPMMAPTMGPPVARSNGVATAAIIFAFFVPLVGLILGIVGIGRSREAGGTGRGLSIAAIVMSIVMMAIGGFVLFGALGGPAKVAERLNPGCVSAEGYFSTFEAKVQADSTDPVAVKADLQAAVDELTKDAAESTNTVAKVAILKLSGDIQIIAGRHQYAHPAAGDHPGADDR